MVWSRAGGHSANHACSGHGAIRSGPALAPAHIRHRLPVVRRCGRVEKKADCSTLDFLDSPLPSHNGCLRGFSSVYSRLAGKSPGAACSRLWRYTVLSPAESDLAGSHGRSQLSLSVSLGLVRMAGGIGAP